MRDMTVEELSKSIVEQVGGAGNIASAVNCMTRLRITVRDDAAIHADALKALPGVLAVFHRQANYVEVVVGPGKSRRCMDALREMGIHSGENPATAAATVRETSDGRLRRVMRLFGRIFAPLIPGIIVSGLCAGVAALIAQLAPGYADNPALSVTYQLLTGINAAFMTYLSAWAGYRAAEAFGGTPVLGGMIGMFTTLENVNAISKTVGWYNDAQPLNAILRAGRGGLIAALIGVWIMCKLETAIRKRMPEALDTVFTPLLTVIFTLVPYVLIIMPFTGIISTGLCRLVGAVALNRSPLVRMLAGFLGASLFLPMVAMGMHHGLIHGGGGADRRGAGHCRKGPARGQSPAVRRHQRRDARGHTRRGGTADLRRDAAPGPTLCHGRAGRGLRRRVRHADGGGLDHMGALRRAGRVRHNGRAQGRAALGGVLHGWPRHQLRDRVLHHDGHGPRRHPPGNVLLTPARGLPVYTDLF